MQDEEFEKWLKSGSGQAALPTRPHDFQVRSAALGSRLPHLEESAHAADFIDECIWKEVASDLDLADATDIDLLAECLSKTSAIPAPMMPHLPREDGMLCTDHSAGVTCASRRREQNLPDLDLSKHPITHVILMVYDVTWATQRAGLPIYHLGVEVHNGEFSYGLKGVEVVPPGGHKTHPFCEAILLGFTAISFEEVCLLGKELQKEYTPTSYHLLWRNCQTFAVAFCAGLGLTVPPEYCRFSEVKPFLGSAMLLPSPQEAAMAKPALGEGLPRAILVQRKSRHRVRTY